MFNDMAISLSQQRKAQLTFLAGVAHDLKNPLSTLKTGMYTLEHEASEVRRGNTRATLDRQVDLLNRMVDDLLDATRIEAGQLELRWATFDLRRLVNDVVRLYVPTAPEHQITSRIPDEPVMVEADGLRIEQVLRNLVSNAIKFSPYGGSVEVALERGSNEVALSVSDRGIGIPRDEHTSIFLPFRRRDLNVAPGAGLGLSVVRRIVSAHGGSIDVESEPGAGSTFRVRLPLARNNARGTAADVP
jgi:signal transduction histidine kinase